MLWRTVWGYEGYYEVSTEGKVRSVNRVVLDKNGRQIFLRGKEMKLTRTKGKDGNGYMVVNLRKFGNSEVIPVHVLVAMMFIPNPNDYPMVNHIDGDKTNNRVDNLEWTTYSYNNYHALQHELRKPRGTVVMQYTVNGDLIEVYDSIAQAARETGICARSISLCINRHTFSAGGYSWERLSEGVSTIL